MTRLHRLMVLTLAMLAIAPAAADAAPPESTSAPVVHGEQVDGEPLWASAGNWDDGGGGSPSFAYQWLRCAADGSACSALAGEASSDYDLTLGDVGSTVRVEVTATNGDGATTVLSSLRGPVEVADAPANVTLPPITGPAEAGELLWAGSGEWGTRTGAISLAYQWLRCDPGGTACASIDGATGTTYSVAAADMDATIRLRATATNPHGSDTADSDATAVVPSYDAPESTTPPTIAGQPWVGGSVYATGAGWGENVGVPAYTHQWLRCDIEGEDCVEIGDPTLEDSRVVASGDAGATLRVRVTASNPVGEDSALSAPVAIPVPGAPVSTTAPTVLGVRVDGEPLSAWEGGWDDADSFAYQWRRCDASGGSCNDIAGATGASYPLGDADVGFTVRVAVTATNSHGAVTALSSPGAVVEVADAPANVTPPSIAGSAEAGSVLSAGAGEWGERTGVISLAYQWLRCDSGGSGCTAIGGADGTSYSVAAADMDATIRLRATATNPHGSDTATSVATAVVPRFDAPVNTAPPSIAGDVEAGGYVYATGAAWGEDIGDVTFTYRWLRCDAEGSGCTEIGDETDSDTYLVDAADAESTLRVRITARNAVGEDDATSEAVEVPPIPAPVNVSPPEVGGYALTGTQLGAWEGWWGAGSALLAYTFQWRRCDAQGDQCADIAGANATSFDLTTADLGSTLRVEVTAENASGTAVAESQPLGPIAAREAPANVAPPSIYGDATVGSLIALADWGQWGDQTGDIDFSLEWLRCEDPEGEVCVPIAGATDMSYELDAADLGSSIRVRVTASNALGSDTASSLASAVVSEP